MSGVKYKVEVDTSDDAMVFETRDSVTGEVDDDPWKPVGILLSVAVLLKLLGLSHKKSVEDDMIYLRFGQETWVQVQTVKSRLLSITSEPKFQFKIQIMVHLV